MSRSHFTFFQIPKPILTPSTVIYLLESKVTKTTIYKLYAYASAIVGKGSWGHLDQFNL